MINFKNMNNNYILNEDVENEIIQLQYSIDKLQEKLDSKKQSLLDEIEKNENIYDNFMPNKVKITYIRPTTRESFESSKLKKENIELYNKYVKISNVKSSIKLKIDN